MKTRIIVDSTADLVPEIKERVYTVPLTVHFGQEEYIDGVTIDHRTFYEKLVESDVLPTTSQATPNDFIEEFEKAKQAGEAAVVITLASKFSGTYQSAVIAASEHENIYVVDGTSAAMGTGILAELALYGITAERKSLYDDLQVLEKFGMDICKSKSSTVKYYVASREFELPELKLLVDAIQSSKFITEKKSISLIHKLEGLASVHDGKELQRQVFVANRAKTMNERIYYSVDKIQNAIALNRKISFKYYRWELDFSGTERIVKREKIRNGGYTASPWALCWDDENYYLIAYDTCADSIKHYRVDKMDDIEVLDDERDGGKTFEKFDPAGYSKGVFSMFGGEKTTVKLSVDNDCIGVIVDRFGRDIFVTKESDTTFGVSVDIMTSKQFYAWVFGLGGKVRIISPQNVVDEFKKQLENVNDSF